MWPGFEIVFLKVDFEEFKYYVDEITELTYLSEKLKQKFSENMFIYLKIKKLYNAEYYILIEKSWRKCENENSFSFAENH